MCHSGVGALSHQILLQTHLQTWLISSKGGKKKGKGSNICQGLH